MKEWYLVEVEFKRIQSFLFSAPTLKAMIGANVILGETIRGLWLGLEKKFDPKLDCLPCLACKFQSRWPEDVQFKIPETLNAANAAKDDPLYYLDDSGKRIFQDDVKSVAEQTGILSRDGGHFEALFDNAENAENFCSEAKNLCFKRLPGLIVETRIKKLEFRDGVLSDSNNFVDLKNHNPVGETIFDLPQFVDCEVTGYEPACKVEKTGEKATPIGYSTSEKDKAFDKFKTGDSRDLIGLMRESIISSGKWEKLIPKEFETLAENDSGYMGVIVADGNSVGKRIKELGATEGKDVMTKWAERETIFYKIRLCIRKAFVASLKSVFKIEQEDERFSFQPLMIGGDDLLFVCGASKSLEFAKIFSEKVKEHTSNLPCSRAGANESLTLGIGVAIVRDSFPFFKAHYLAEQLASSAKQLKNAVPNESYIDWLVVSESWHDDLEKIRRSDAIVKAAKSTVLLTGKPYCITNGQKNGSSLSKLIDFAEDFRKKSGNSSDVAWSQLKKLIGELAQGEYVGEFGYHKLPRKQKEWLKEFTGNDSPWEKTESFTLTRVGDLCEIIDLMALTTDKQSDGADSSNAK